MSEDCARACGGSLCVYRLSDNAMLVVRAIILVAALVSFSVMSSIEDASSYSEFNFLVFTGVVVFIYSIVQILYGIAVQLSPSVPVRTRLIKVVEVIVESVLCIFAFSAGVASAYRLDTVTDFGFIKVRIIDASSDAGSLTTSTVFMFFVFFASLVGLYGRFTDWRLDVLGGPARGDYEDIHGAPASGSGADPYRFPGAPTSLGGGGSGGDGYTRSDLL